MLAGVGYWDTCIICGKEGWREGLSDLLEMGSELKGDQSRCSEAELGMRLGAWNWNSKRIGVELSSAFLLPLEEQPWGLQGKGVCWIWGLR